MRTSSLYGRARAIGLMHNKVAPHRRQVSKRIGESEAGGGQALSARGRKASARASRARLTRIKADGQQVPRLLPLG